MKTIKCNCGTEFQKHYYSPYIDDNKTLRDTYHWTCSDCGQQFSEKAKSVVELGDA